MGGRCHLYEGLGPAAGGPSGAHRDRRGLLHGDPRAPRPARVHEDLAAGSIVVVEDHLNLTGQEPPGGAGLRRPGGRLRPGAPLHRAGGARDRPRRSWRRTRGSTPRCHGPQFETPAEVRMLRSARARTSSACPWPSRRSPPVTAGAEVLGLALVTNKAAASGILTDVGRDLVRRSRGHAGHGLGGAPRRSSSPVTSPVAPAGVDHVAINVPDVPGAIAFYTEKLGLVQNSTRPDFGFAGAWLDTASGQQVHLIELPAPPNVGQHFALVFDDLDAVVGCIPGEGARGDRSGPRRWHREAPGFHLGPLGKRDRAAPTALRADLVTSGPSPPSAP